MTSKDLRSTPSQSVISPIAENHVNDSIDIDIINKPIPSINNSLPATQITGINTAPRVLTIRNSSVNAKFGSSESKLCRKIIAIISGR